MGRTLVGAILILGIATSSSSNCEAQSGPVLKTYAYEREVIGGIPGGPPGVGAPARQLRYFIYLETVPKADFTVEGVWMKSQLHAVEIEIKQAPVRFDSPVKLADEARTIAVPATTNTVTEIVVKDPQPGRTPDAQVKEALREHAAAVQLRYSGKSILLPIRKFEPRDPIYQR